MSHSDSRNTIKRVIGKHYAHLNTVLGQIGIIETRDHGIATLFRSNFIQRKRILSIQVRKNKKNLNMPGDNPITKNVTFKTKIPTKLKSLDTDKVREFVHEF